VKALNYTWFVLIAILTMSFCVSAQEINPVLYKNTWQDNETKTLYGYDITKIFGQLPNDAATYNYSPITAVSYKNLQSLESISKKVGEAEKWTPEALNENIKNLQKIAVGGQIQLYLTRYNEDMANLRWYFIIIRGVDDKGKIWEYDLPYKAPQSPVNNGWWNYTTINIPIELPEKFYIYLNDKKSEFLSDFKFLVEKNN